MDNKKNNKTQVFQVLVLLVLLNSCNSGNIKPDLSESIAKPEATVQAPTISYEECDTLRSSLNYRYGFVFEKKDSIQENTTVHYMVRMYYDHFNEINSWEGYGPFYNYVGVTSFYAFPKNSMNTPICIFEIDGINNRLTAFGKQIRIDDVLKYQTGDDFNLYYIASRTCALLCADNIADANDMLVVNCSFGYLRQNVKNVFHRSYILDITSKACVSVGEYVGACYWTNTTGDIVGSGQIYAERGFGGLAYGYIYMDRMNYLGWNTKLQEYNPELYTDAFPYDAPNKSWTFGPLDSKYQMPISMTRGGDCYEFDYANRVITHFVNNKRTESLYYDNDLDDPRIWDVENKTAKVLQYKMSNGVLTQLVYYSKPRDLYMTIPLNDEGEEIRVTGVYRKAKEGEFDDEQIVDVTMDILGYNPSSTQYSVFEIDSQTGLKRKVKTILGRDNLKNYLLEHYLGW